MFLRSNKRFKNGKSHRYWNIVENKRTSGSEWRLHRLWYEQSAIGDLLGEDFGLVQKDILS